MAKQNKKIGILDGHDGWKLRIFHKQAKGCRSPRYLVKCGCCENKVEIYYDEFGLEINGVHASKEEWLNVLKPLLNM